MKTLYLALLVRGARLLTRRAQINDANPVLDLVCALLAEPKVPFEEIDHEVIPMLTAQLQADEASIAAELADEFAISSAV
jgi:hypothetical protein